MTRQYFPAAKSRVGMPQTTESIAKALRECLDERREIERTTGVRITEDGLVLVLPVVKPS